ncbi:uncharacterized protein LOC131931484 [Physella acuta]|uniref:uncharacterized protein LOC131931484 n=1 Tax=Physella acuta TaxID=109671 RepID=UPI0027DE71E1|nr:uncharacterized protein LOC131931484 [Physella acuta]
MAGASENESQTIEQGERIYESTELNEFEFYADEFHQLASIKHCTKYPGHVDFIPVEDFNLQHLPGHLQDPDIVQLIKCLSNLTVMVRAKSVSPERPEFYPDTDLPYPLHVKPGRKMNRQLRTGTARVSHPLWKYVEEDDVPCPCAACKVSSTPVKTWCQIPFVTATHVIFDSHELKDTQVVIDYNSARSNKIVLDVFDDGGFSVFTDRADIICSTHDVSLYDRLQAQKKEYENLRQKLAKKYNEKDKSTSLAIMVSHPHGNAKHVTVGQWTNRCQAGRHGDVGYTYNTPSCTGSSGAPVYILGEVNWLRNQVHSGVRSDGNFAGVKFFTWDGEGMSQLFLYS